MGMKLNEQQKENLKHCNKPLVHDVKKIFKGLSKFCLVNKIQIKMRNCFSKFKIDFSQTFNLNAVEPVKDFFVQQCNMVSVTHCE